MAGGGAEPQGGLVGDVEALRALFEHSAVPQFVADHRGALLLANPAYVAFVGMPLSEVLGSVPADVTHPEELPTLVREGRRLLAGEVEALSVELRVRTADGTYRWCLATCSSAPSSSGARLVVCQLLDIDDRRRAEEDLASSLAALIEAQEQVQRLAAIAETTGDLVGIIDAKGWLVWANEAARVVHGLDNEVPIHSTKLYTSESLDRFFEQILPMLRRGDRWMGELDMYAADGRVISIWQSLAPQLDLDGTLVGISGVGRDLTDRKQREADLTFRATHDDLTGLPNRALLLDRLGALVDGETGRSGHVALLFLDLDGFKAVNDELGHDAGDSLLRVVAERLSAALRSMDVVARLGGDEFVVLCPGLARTEAEEVAHRLLQAVSATPIKVGDRLIDITASVGVAIAAPSAGQHAEGLLREADVAMYQAKALGRNRVEVYGG